MDGPRDCHTEWSKSGREGKISYGIPYVQNLKRNDTSELTHKTETDLKNELMVAGGREDGEGIIRGLELTYTHCYIFKMEN